MESVVATPKPKITRKHCHHPDRPVTISLLENNVKTIAQCCRPCANILISKCDFKEVSKE